MRLIRVNIRCDPRSTSSRTDGSIEELGPFSGVRAARSSLVEKSLRRDASSSAGVCCDESRTRRLSSRVDRRPCQGEKGPTGTEDEGAASDCARCRFLRGIRDPETKLWKGFISLPEGSMAAGCGGSDRDR
jgi:hypothetical protein